MKRAVSVLVAVAVTVSLLGVVACEESGPSPAQQEKLEGVIRAYLNDLAEAYSEMDPGLVAPHATAAEVEQVRRLLQTLHKNADRVDAELLQVDITGLRVFRGTTAHAELVEVWDITRLDAFTGRVKGHNPNAIQHAWVSLMEKDGEWLVSSHQVKETEGPSAWTVETPAPEGDADTAPDAAAGGGEPNPSR